jgi:hypothetical protein
MSKEVKNKEKDNEMEKPRFKLRLDAKTIITIRSLAALKAWRERYPQAILLE